MEEDDKTVAEIVEEYNEGVGKALVPTELVHIVPDITAILRNVSQVGDALVGEIHGDLHGRFVDGKRIITSPIVKKHTLYQTENSLYLVEE